MQSNIKLNPLKDDLPYQTQCVKNFCEANNIAFKLSRNNPAYGCKDAASKRFNGRGRGIPLCRELKTLLCTSKSHKGSLLFAVHMSASRSACFKNIRQALEIKKSCDVILAGETELHALGMRLGTVNPFSLAIKINQNIIQIFDSELLKINQSMFTNAGELTFGIEFNIQDLIKSINKARIFNISKESGEVFK